MIAGRHSVDECFDLMDYFTWRVGQLQKSYDGISQDAMRTDPTLPEQWAALVKRWETAKGEAKRHLLVLTLTTPGVPNALIPAEDDWQNMQQACSRPGAVGYIYDLQQRITKLNPRPFDPAPKFFGSTSADDVALGGAIVVTDTVKDAEKKLPSFARPTWWDENWGKVVVGGGLLLVGGFYVARKTSSRVMAGGMRTMANAGMLPEAAAKLHEGRG